MGDPTKDELWARIEKLTAFKKEAVHAIKLAYGCLSGSIYRVYEGRGGPTQAHKETLEELKRVLTGQQISPRALSLEWQTAHAKNLDDRIMSMKEVAAMLGLKPGSLSDRIQRGEDHPPFFKFGQRYLFRRSELTRWIKNQEITAKRGRGSRMKPRRTTTTEAGDAAHANQHQER
jgi:predicted DNA-binding transcriptional regulator AlpA